MGNVLDFDAYRQKKLDAESTRITVGIDPSTGYVMIVIQNPDSQNIIIGLERDMATSLAQTIQEVASSSAI